jgi:hypothetical protein
MSFVMSFRVGYIALAQILGPHRDRDFLTLIDVD